MINWILSSSVLILIMMLLRFVLRGKISLRLQYALWLLVAVRLLVPINFGNTFLSLENYTQPVNSQSVEANNESETVQTVPVTDESEKIKVYDAVRPQKNEQETAATKPDKMIIRNIIFDTVTLKILQTVWILGILVVGFAFAASNLVFSYRIRKTRKNLCIPYATIPVYVSDSIDTPCLFHLFHPTIYLTTNLKDDEKLLFHAVSHEMTHFYHKDLWWNVVRCVCLIIHWYNPLVWWAAVLSKRDCELACDEATIERLGEKERLDYGKTLIRLTCRKQKDFFVVSTSMTAGRKSIKERIRLIAKKPKTTLIGGIFLILVLVIATGCTFTRGLEKEPDRELPENTDAQAEPAMEDIAQSDTNITPTFYEEPDRDSVCLAVMPDGISKAGGDYRYLIPENQIYWVSEYKEMKSLAIGDGAWKEDEKSMGIWLVFRDEWTHVTDQGFIVNFDARVNKEDALDFYQLCMEEANKNGVGNPVRPEDITELTSAILNYNETYEVTDPLILEELQKILSASKELRGGAACPFTASMDLQLKNHQTIRIYLATDSCSVWLSDGVYYQVYGYYGNEDIDDLYNLFRTNGIPYTAGFNVTNDGLETDFSDIKDEVYRKLIKELLDTGVFPASGGGTFDGLPYENFYCITDVDQDGHEELIINCGNANSMAGMAYYIYDYNRDTGNVYVQCYGFPSITIYENGYIKENASHNHGRSSLDDFWPYNLYQYNPQKDQYETIGYIDAWQSTYYGQGEPDPDFPKDKDLDGDGIVYYCVTDDYYHPEWIMDNSEYEQWCQQYLLGKQKNLNWIPIITEEQYRQEYPDKSIG